MAERNNEATVKNAATATIVTISAEVLNISIVPYKIKNDKEIAQLARYFISPWAETVIGAARRPKGRIL